MTPSDPTRPDAAEANVSRLLEQANHTAEPSPDFTRRLHARLLSVATEEARRRTAPVPRARAFGGRLATLSAAAALLGAITLGFQFWPATPSATLPRHTALRPDEPAAAPRPERVAAQRSTRALVRDRLTAAPRPAVPRLVVVGAGNTLRTGAGERRRVRLDDDSVLFLNENTTATYDGVRHVTLAKGEVFVEVAPRRAADADALFTVQAPRQAVQALGTKFVVRAADAGPGVAVTQGKVKVDRTVVTAGQQLAPGSDRPTPAPRASHLLAWTRDLIAATAGTLVPASRHAGGALVAVDPQGQEANLSLRKYHVDVHVEDGFARTTIDQTYFNHMPYRLEGTFFFPLPADASLSRLAMYVNGELMEGGMVERDYGRAVFEQIVKKMQDPALLEWVDGSTFKMRVFPLEGRQEKRIVLSYTQRLPGLYGRLAYRFPAGHSLEAVRDWSFHARVKDGAALAWQCSSHALTPRPDGADLVLEAKANKVRVDRDIVLELGEASRDAGPAEARFSSAEQDGARYLMLRYRPELTTATRRQRRDWVFLVETSGDRNPLLARTQVEIVRTLLANAEHDDTFTLLTAGTRVRTWSPTPHPVTPENVAAALAFLEGAHLVGALDLDRGLKAAAELLARSGNPHLVHVGSGLAVLGEGRSDRLLKQIPARACYVGVGVGKRWARSFMKQAAERSQGYFTQINPDEPVAWRAFDLLATLNTPRLMDVRVVAPAGKATFLSDTSSVCQGEELCAMARLDGGPLPEAVTVTGLLDGKPFRRVLPVWAVRPKADYLPRTWARLEIERLLAADAAKNKAAIIALSKAMYVMTPFTSLLVLENEAMYAQFKVDRGRKDHWAMYPCPAKIPVVYEPLPGRGMLHLYGEYNFYGLMPTDGSTVSNEYHGYRPQVYPPGIERLARLDSEQSWMARVRQEGFQARTYAGADLNGNLTEAVGLAAALQQRIAPPGLYNVPPPPGTGGGTGGNPVMTEPVLRSMADGSVREAQALYYLSHRNPMNAESVLGNRFGTVGGKGGIYNPGGFGGRSGGWRWKLLDQGGGTPLSERAVADGLRWLALHQAADGHWSLHQFNRHARTSFWGNRAVENGTGLGRRRNDVLATGLALLPLLGAGQQWEIEFSRKAIVAGLDYLRGRQRRDGGIGPDLESHALATIALCEGYALTADPKLKKAAQRALDYLVAVQETSGGWRNTPRAAPDLGVTGWQLMAIRTGQMAYLRVPKAAMRKVQRFLDACETAAGFGPAPGKPATDRMTAIGMLCREYLGVSPRHRSLLKCVKRLQALPPDKCGDLLYLFFATQAMRHLDNKDWRSWNDPRGQNGMRDTLIRREDQGGSWAPDATGFTRDAGRPASTALAVLCLQSYYRQVPLYGRELWTTAPTDLDEQALLLLIPHFRLPAPGYDLTAAEWGRRLRQAARNLRDRGRRAAIVGLLEVHGDDKDRALVDDLLGLALDGPAPRAERFPAVLVAVAYLASHGRDDRADRVLGQALADPELAREPILWRMGVGLATRRKQDHLIVLSRLERAVELEYEHLPAVYDVGAIRHDYGRLLSHYEKLAAARPPKDLVSKTLRIADRWRALDPAAKAPCEAAARVLRQLKKPELAWEYETTALASPAGPSGWLAAAKEQAMAKAYDHADQAFAAAFALEPGNARVLWDRAMNLLQARRPSQAHALLRELAEGTWDAKHKDVQVWARALMQR